MSISIEELEALVTIMELGSFRAAAEKLHKSQSSISYAIKNIEKDLSIELFDRSTYKPKLTSAGELIYNKAKNILSMHHELADMAGYINKGVEAKISVVFSVIFPTVVLQKILKSFKEKYPQTQLEISFESFDVPINKLLGDNADIIVASDYRDKGDLDKEFFSTIEFMPVADSSHPTTQSGFDERLLNSMTEIVVGERALTAETTLSGVIEHPNTWHVMDYGLKKKLLLAGLGWGFMPKDLIKKALDSGTLVKIPCKNISYINLYLIRLKSQAHGPAASYFWELLKEASSR